MKRDTKKITVSLPQDTLRITDDNCKRFGFQKRSEFIDAALREYISRDLLKEFTGELTQLYGKIERSEIKSMEEHLAKLSYKIAVELAQVNLLLTSTLDLDSDDISKLRRKALELVNSSRGYVPLKKANQNQVELRSDMELDDVEPPKIYQTEIRNMLFSVTCEGPETVDDATMDKILRAIQHISISSNERPERK